MIKKHNNIVFTFVIILILSYIYLTTGCYIPSYPMDRSTSLSTSHPMSRRTTTSNESTTIASPTTEDKEKAGNVKKSSCNIWCWIRKVGLFIVQQLLSD